MCLLPPTSCSRPECSAWLLITIPTETSLHFRYEMHCQLFYLAWFTVPHLSWRLVQDKTSQKVSRCSLRSSVFAFGSGWVLFSFFFFFPKTKSPENLWRSSEDFSKQLPLSPTNCENIYLSFSGTHRHGPLPGQMFAEPEEPGLQPPQRGETTRPRTGSCQPLIAEPLFDRQPWAWIKMFVFAVISLIPSWMRKAFIFRVAVGSPRSIVLGNT